MNITIEDAGPAIIATLDFDVLDAGNSAVFKDSIKPLLDEHTNIILDLSNLTFVDSSGLGAFLSCLRQLSRKGGDLKFVDVQKPVRMMFELVRMHKIVDILNSRDEALKAFDSGKD